MVPWRKQTPECFGTDCYTHSGDCGHLLKLDGKLFFFLSVTSTKIFSKCSLFSICVSKGGNQRFHLALNKKRHGAKLQTTGMGLLFILRSNKEVECIIINPRREAGKCKRRNVTVSGALRQNECTSHFPHQQYLSSFLRNLHFRVCQLLHHLGAAAWQISQT